MQLSKVDHRGYMHDIQIPNRLSLDRTAGLINIKMALDLTNPAQYYDTYEVIL